MNVDTAIQNVLHNGSRDILANMARVASKPHLRRPAIIRYQHYYGWTLDDCNEFLDNISLAHKMLSN